MPTSANGLPDKGSRRHLSLNHDITEEGRSRLALELSVLEDHDRAPDEVSPEVVALLLRHLVDRLDEPIRSAVVMTTLNGLPYSEAASRFYVDLGRDVHKMQVWRWNSYGLRQVREWLEGTPWVSVLMRGRVPLPPDEDPSIVGPEDLDAVLRPDGPDQPEEGAA